MPRYRKKPVEIDAWQWLDQPLKEWPSWLFEQEGQYRSGGSFFIRTLEGTMEARPGDWIIRGVKGELYPCRDDIFQQTYDPAPPAAEE